MQLGIDVGSTTVKLVMLDGSQIKYKKYRRHQSDVFNVAIKMLRELIEQVGDIDVKVAITGSGGLGMAQVMNAKFEQEVIACTKAIEEIIPQTDVAIELGGEDAKLTFLKNSVEQRMNGTCAGGTGAFIDQMAVLLDTDAEGLNEAAKNYKTIYPIAARCGVFAKTDIQPLINEGAKKEDLAASIFQAVVNQTISGLACGRTIEGKVAFLGGPLSFSSELRKRFVETLKIKPEDVIFPENAKYFVALGAAYLAKKEERTFSLSHIVDTLSNIDRSKYSANVKTLEPLFKNGREYEGFKKRHDKSKAARANIEKAKGPVYLGIDAGSTTTKAVLMDDERRILYSFYAGNEGKPLEVIRKILIEIYDKLPETAYIARSTVTGYGEAIAKEGFKIDDGLIETVAHYTAAENFLPGVEFILDIGGQDMKCMRIRNGAIYNIMLNEACSSGCGSFLEIYAKSVGLDAKQFAEKAVRGDAPVDLGTRCTVFMNSKVKQAQKEGIGVENISAGLAYSVIKNALYKVIKLRDPNEAGEKIVVQGGTFLSDAVLKAIENILDKEVVRPDIAALMGAFGAAIYSQKRAKEVAGDPVSGIIKRDELNEFTVSSYAKRCNLCPNNCMLTISEFNSGKKFVMGNRCERGAGKEAIIESEYNLYKYKQTRLFSCKSLGKGAKKGDIGIPRVLNMYENYPFWHALFTELGYNVVVSPPSKKSIYDLGIDTISSDTACYPAKLVHGHIKWLGEHGIKRIFMPCINHEFKEDAGANNHFNCPIVATYAEVIGNNMKDYFEHKGIEFHSPFLPYIDDKKLLRELKSGFLGVDGASAKEIKAAIQKGRVAMAKYKYDVMAQGKKVIDYARKNGKKIVLLAGRPYHIDPEINHGIDGIINSVGMVVISEDSIPKMHSVARPLRVLDQWTYHSRMYRAAEFAGKYKDIELVQLNSFGCGLDAVTTDQIEEICEKHNKLYTVLKIDEGENLGAAKIRIRSLLAAMEEREKTKVPVIEKIKGYERRIFDKDMKKNYNLIIPQMSPIHFRFIEPLFKREGFRPILLPDVDKEAIDVGLKYINNDACYPTIVSLGQIISYIQSADLDLDKTAIIFSQTGGGCRASNYIALLRKALEDIGLAHIPVVSFNTVGLEKNPGFKLSLRMLKSVGLGLIYGDVLMRLINATRPYEKIRGSADALLEKWIKRAETTIFQGGYKDMMKDIREAIKDFDNLDRINIKKPRVGVVGEILVKYHPNANNQIVQTIEAEGGEAVVTELMDFMLYCAHNDIFNYETLAGKRSKAYVAKFVIWFLERLRKDVKKAFSESKHFEPPKSIYDTASKAKEIVSLGNQCGEGWLLTGEMVDMLDEGIENIVCLQPFACLPNHVTGKGVMKILRKRNPKANIVAIDYDPGASEVNQLNRIKLMMGIAHKNLNTEGK